jgi:hypothetical protein
MEYWNDFLTKSGFGDGNSVPDDADVIRDFCVQIVNHFANKFGSKVETVEFNRGGLHNWCIVVFVDNDQMAAPDDEMDKAVEAARSYWNENKLQDLVWVTDDGLSVNNELWNMVMVDLNLAPTAA